MATDRKPPVKMDPPPVHPETKKVYPMRLKPSEIARLKARARQKGIGHSTLGREWLLMGEKMDRVEQLEKNDTRITA